MKKLLALILATLMIMSMIPLAVFADGTDPVECGDDLTWTFKSSTGVLTISGSGDMNDFNAELGDSVVSHAPWAANISIIKTVVLSDELTSIGNNAFAGCSSLSEITIPESVTRIGDNAFYGCTSLKSLIISDNLSELGDTPFDEDCVINYTGTESEWKKITGYDIENTVNFEYCEHELTYVEPVYATTTSTGNIGFYKCDECEKCFKDADATVKLSINQIVTNKVLNPYYSDVSTNDWYYESVAYCSDKGYFCGVGGNQFNPLGELTREQFMQVLFSFAGEKKEDWKGSTGFADVPNGEWYSPAIKWARTNSVTYGVSENVFGLGVKITREQFANLMKNYAELIGEDVSDRAVLSDYTDSTSISAWAVEGMQWAVAAGLISGTTPTTLSPLNIANRATATMIFMNFDRYLAD